MAGTTILSALSRAEELRPHFVFVLARLFPVKTPGSGSVTADRLMRLYFDPEAVSKMSPDMAAALIILQVEHYFRRHPARQLGREQVLWDFATAIAVSCDLDYEGLDLPDNYARPKTFGLPAGRAAEWYYGELERLSRKRRQFLEQAEFGGQSFGSAASAELKDWELPEDDPATPAIDYLLALQQMRELEDQSGGPPGHGAGDELRTVGIARNSNVNWRVKLGGTMGSLLSTRPGSSDYSFLVPDWDVGLNPPGIIMPGMAGRKSNIALVIDTSSSMNEKRLAQVIAEAGAILKTLDGNEGVFVYPCDAAVHGAKEVFLANQISLIGNGGTDLGPGIKAAAARMPRPDIMVVLTDGDTPWPSQGPRGVRVVILLVGNSDSPTPKWATSVIRVLTD